MARSIAAAPGRTNRRFLILAIAFAGLSAGLIYAWMASTKEESGGPAAAGSLEVVVANQPIKPRTAIVPEMLEVKALPVNAVVDGHYTTVEDVVGKVTRLPIEANQQIISSAVVDTERPVTDALSLVVPDGRRAFSINASPVVTAGGLLLPGDYVDIVWVCCEQGLEFGAAPGQPGEQRETDAIILAKTIVQNVPVAAVAQQVVESGPVATGDGSTPEEDPVAGETGTEDPEAVTITLLVTPEQAHILLMGESTGELRTALRGPGDTALVPTGADYTLTTPGLIPAELLEQLRQLYAPAQ